MKNTPLNLMLPLSLTLLVLIALLGVGAERPMLDVLVQSQHIVPIAVYLAGKTIVLVLLWAVFHFSLQHRTDIRPFFGTLYRVLLAILLCLAGLALPLLELASPAALVVTGILAGLLSVWAIAAWRLQSRFSVLKEKPHAA